MYFGNLKRGISLVIALILAISMMPVPAFATEANSAEDSAIGAESPKTEGAEEAVITEAYAETIPAPPAECTSVPTEETVPQTADLCVELAQEMDRILLTYLNATVLSEDEVIDIVNTMHWDDMEKAVSEIETLASGFSELSEDESSQLRASYAGADTIECFYEVLQLAMTPTVFADGSYTPVDNVSVKVSNASSTDESNGTITVTARGSWGLFSGYIPQTSTITITNSSATDQATISFDWSATDVNSLTIDGIDYSGQPSNSFSKLLNANAQVTVVITTGKNTTKNTLVMKNFSWVKASSASKVKFDFDPTLGSVTVDGTAVADEDEKEIPLAGANLVATPSSGSTFLAWIDGNNKILSTTADFTLEPTADMTAKAVFIKSNSTTPWFRVGTDYLFDDLNAADTFAKTATNRLIALLRSGTLPSGKNYTISSGNSLLIPYSDTDTGVFEGVPSASDAKTAATKAFRTLTIPDGVTLTVAGAMSVNAVQGTPGAGDTGHVTGAFGQVILNGNNAKITVTGSLTCYGYITGTGMVHAQSGAKVYEMFQLRDWRGGSQTMTWYNDSLFGSPDPRTNSFICNEYYIQNIESRYRVDTGALAYVSAAMSMAVVGVQQAQAVYIGTGGLFQLGNNSFVIREYKASEDRIYYDLYGTVTTAGINLKVSSYELNTSSFILGVHHSMTITIKGTDLSGSTLSSSAKISKAFKLLPGAEMIVEENAKLEIDSSTTLYLYDLYDWVKDGTSANSYIYWGSGNTFQSVQSVKYSASGKGTRKAQASAVLHVDGTLIGYSNIFTTNDGSTQPDKVITGSGTFINNAAASGYSQVALDEFKANDSANNKVYIDTLPVVGLLAGISENTSDVNDSFSTDTYYGLGPDHNNYWYQTAQPTAPTCTEAGYTIYNCTGGSGYRVEGDPALGHKYSDWEVTNPATFDAPGVESRNCTVCENDPQTRPIPQLVAVAKIGETRYETIAEAFDKASTGCTLELLAEVTEDVVADCTMTVVLGDFSESAENHIKAGDGFTRVFNADGTLSILTQFKIYGTSVKAGDCLDMFFYVKKDNLVGTDYYAVVTKTFADGRDNVVETYPYYSDDGKMLWVEHKDYPGLVRFCFDDISAKEMTDEIYVTIYNGDGTPASREFTETIQSYAVRSLKAYANSTGKSLKLCTTLIDMLNYGAAAQEALKYNNTDPKELANYGCEAYQRFASTDANCDYEGRVVGTGLTSTTIKAESNLTFRLFFNRSVFTDSTYDVHIYYYDHYGTLYDETFEKYAFKTDEAGLYGVDVTGLAIADGRQLIGCDIINSSGEIVSSSKYSIECYIKDNENSVDAVYTMLMRFVDSAWEYFHYPNER